jgi:hypothetical protein
MLCVTIQIRRWEPAGRPVHSHQHFTHLREYLLGLQGIRAASLPEPSAAPQKGTLDLHDNQYAKGEAPYLSAADEVSQNKVRQSPETQKSSFSV